MDGRDCVSIVVAVGSYAIALMYGYLGSELFVTGATGGFKFMSSAGANSVGIESVAPGLAFAFFGMFMSVFALLRLVDKPGRCPLARPVQS